jgi:predicted glycosyltransferase
LGGGLGHLNRAVSLARATARYTTDSKAQSNPKNSVLAAPNGSKDEVVQAGSLRFTIVTNSPYAASISVESEIGADHQLVRLPENLNPTETAQRTQQLINSSDYPAIIVDTFPRGLAGELAGILPNLDCKKILIHRDLNPIYASKYDLHKFVMHYDRLIAPGEQGCLSTLEHLITTPPWFNRDSQELLSPYEAKKLLEIKSPDKPAIAIMGCGRKDECEQMSAFANRLALALIDRAKVIFVSPNKRANLPHHSHRTSAAKAVSLWPFFQAIRGVDLIVGSGGYNTVNEARAAGIEYIGIPWERLYDRQRNRLRKSELALNLEEAKNLVMLKIESLKTGPLIAPQFTNGVHQTLEELCDLLTDDS